MRKRILTALALCAVAVMIGLMSFGQANAPPTGSNNLVAQSDATIGELLIVTENTASNPAILNIAASTATQYQNKIQRTSAALNSTNNAQPTAKTSGVIVVISPTGLVQSQAIAADERKLFSLLV